MEVEYRKHWPDEIRVIVEEAIERGLALDLLPTWVTHLWVYYDDEPADDSDDAPITVLIEPMYLNVKLSVRAGFIEAKPETRDSLLIHEFFHVHLAPMALAALDFATEIEKTNEGLAARLREELHRADERATTGLEAMYNRRPR